MAGGFLELPRLIGQYTTACCTQRVVTPRVAGMHDTPACIRLSHETFGHQTRDHPIERACQRRLRAAGVFRHGIFDGVSVHWTGRQSQEDVIVEQIHGSSPCLPAVALAKAGVISAQGVNMLKEYLDRQGALTRSARNWL